MPRSSEYGGFYKEIRANKPSNFFTYTPYFLVVLVDAKHLDYFENRSFFCTLVKHPEDGNKGCDVGHCWILLNGIVDGERIEVEGGHSGETGLHQTKYMDGVMHLMECGDENPIRYMWTVQRDGFFQQGSGGHTPSYAVKFNLTKEQFEEIYRYIHSGEYDYKNYSLTKNQCCEFVRQVALKAGVDFDTKITLKIDSEIGFRNDTLHLWSDPRYSEMRLSSPDVVEQSLHKLVKEGKGECALKWYNTTHPKPKRKERHCPGCAIYRVRRVLHYR